MNYFVPFSVKLRKTKESKKNQKAWPLDETYSVLAMDVEKIRHKQYTDIEDLDHPLSDSNDNGLVEGDGYVGLDMDDYDEEEMEERLAKANAQNAGIEQVRTWLLISRQNRGFKWVTSEEVKFYSISS